MNRDRALFPKASSTQEIGGILSSILRLGIPTSALIALQTLMGVVETYFVSYLGVNALAGVSAVFPCLMVMQIASSAGLGVAISSCVARALGAQKISDAEAIVLSAAFLGALIGALFAGTMFLFGEWFFRMLGCTGDALAAAVTYANIAFGASALIWISNLLMGALRGSGNVIIPALLSLLGYVVALPLSFMLIFGFGPLPQLGVAGAALGIVIYYFITTLVLIVYLRRGNTTPKLTFSIGVIRRRHLSEILRLGIPTALSATITPISAIIVTGIVGTFGAAALAGFGIASRLDYILSTIYFGLGSGTLTLVGMSIGANQPERARRIAWIGAFATAIIGEAIGIMVAIFPNIWLGLFSQDEEVLMTGELYFRTVGLLYGAIAMFFVQSLAAQGAGRVLWPLVATIVRAILGPVLGWFVVANFGFGVEVVFILLAISSVVACAIVVTSNVANALSGAPKKDFVEQQQ